MFQRDADQVSESAIWAGIHFRSDVQAANALGAAVGQLLIARAQADG